MDIENSRISAHQVECLRTFLKNTVIQSPEILLDTLCRINRILKTCYLNSSDKNALLYCSIIAKHQQILLQFLTNDNKFVVYTVQKLLIQWILFLSNKEDLDQIDVIENQETLITSLHNIHDTFLENKQNISFGTETEVVLEIYHQVLKDFRHLLLRDRDEDFEEIIVHHFGWRILNILNKCFIIENYMVNGHNTACQTVPNEILVPSLSIIADIKKIEKTANMIDAESINGIMNVIKSLSKKIDINMIHICNFLNHGYHPVIRKVLKILLLVVESKSNVGSTVECLSGVLNYAKRIISISDKIQLEDLLNPDDDRIEFFDNGCYYDCNGKKIGLSLEIVKQLVQIYLSSYLSIVNILINDENSRNELICENTRQVLTDALELSKDFTPSMKLLDRMFNLYVNNDNDLINYMNNVLQLSARLRKLAELPEMINLTNGTELKWILETISSHFDPFLQYCTPHIIFLKFLQSIGFEHSTILDFLISNETRFLEFFVMYCKYLDQNPEGFRTECYKFDKEISNTNSLGETDDYAEKACPDEIFLSSTNELKEDSINVIRNDNFSESYKDGNFGSRTNNIEPDLDTINLVNELFCNLREVIQSLMDKHLFPYNASSLVKRIRKVEETLNSLNY
ncbi:protein Lines-like 1 [Gigaspora margarita]|uniref:Protein Lines-like 1 n=1 Tax=Gigaspora margarita TaxID=4874 RepID=A0A8H3WTM4_GIGMA|nr:protein Lines-like 1 [Gigaspora margarita]